MPAPASPAQRAATDDVGDRIKALRRMYGLSQRQLAEYAGMTNGAVSLIEQNKVSPSIATLRKILGAFSMSIGAFFAFATDQPTQVFYNADELVELGRGPLSLRQVGDDLRGRRLQVLHERYQPDADTGKAMLSHDGEEAGVVIAGQIEVTVGGQRRVLGRGDAYYFDSRMPHRFRNVGAQPGEIVSVCTPPTF